MKKLLSYIWPSPVIMQIAWVHLVSKKRQTIVAMLGVTFGITIFLFQAGIMTGFQTSFIDKTLNTSAHIRVFNDVNDNERTITERYKLAGDNLVFARTLNSADKDPKIRNGYQIIRKLEQHPDVVAVAPFLSASVILKAGIMQTGGRVQGVDIIKENEMFAVGEYMIDGDMLRLQTIPNGIILGSGLAQKLGVITGDNITVISSKGVTLDMKVVGLSQTGVVANDDNRAYINLRNAQKLLNVSGSYITDINLKVKDVNRAGELAKTIQASFGYKAEDWKTANANIFSIFRVQNITTYLIITSILIVSGFGIFNILMMMIYEKMPDIAILKSIGFKDREIEQLFLTEALVIGLCGGLMGLVMGFAAGKIISSIPMNIKGFVKLEYIVVNQSPGFFALAMLFALVSTALAGYIPARKASRIDPIDIIRGK